jgi:hypothetical protein
VGRLTWFFRADLTPPSRQRLGFIRFTLWVVFIGFAYQVLARNKPYAGLRGAKVKFTGLTQTLGQL